MNDNQGMIKVGVASSSIEAEQIVNYLEENHIVAYSQGGIMSLYEGNSVSDHEILVRNEDCEKAKTLLRSYVPIKAYSFSQNRDNKANRLVKWVLLSLMVVIIMLPVLFILFELVF